MRSTIGVLILFLPSIFKGNAEELHYKGCFHTSFVERFAFYYKINASLSFTECIAACRNRLTRYVGLHKDLSFPTFNFVFCGNDLPDVSPRTENSRCLQCDDNKDHSCGGNETMSVYMLRESNELALLLETDHGVELLEHNKTTLRVPFNISSGSSGFDYIYTKDEIVFVNSTTIVRSLYSYPVMKYFNYNHLTDSSLYTFSLRIDFVNVMFYWSYWSSDDIYKNDLRTKMKYLVSDRSQYPKYLSIDPYRRLIFFLEYSNPHVYVYDMNTEKVKNMTAFSFHVEHIYALAADIHQKLLYGIISLKGETSRYLVFWDYEVTEMRILFLGPELTNFYIDYAGHFDVFNGTVVWMSYTNSVRTFYKCKLTPRCLKENLSVLYNTESESRILSLKIYHPEKQTPGEKRLCENMNCSHSCKAFSPFTAICTCPPGMEIGSDNSTCLSLPPTTEEGSTRSVELSTQSTLKDQFSTSTQPPSMPLSSTSNHPTSMAPSSTSNHPTSMAPSSTSSHPSSMAPTFLQTEGPVYSTSESKIPARNVGTNEWSYLLPYLTVSNVIILVMLFVIVLVILRIYRKQTKMEPVMMNTLELRQNDCEILL